MIERVNKYSFNNTFLELHLFCLPLDKNMLVQHTLLLQIYHEKGLFTVSAFLDPVFIKTEYVVLKIIYINQNNLRVHNLVYTNSQIRACNIIFLS